MPRFRLGPSGRPMVWIPFELSEPPPFRRTVFGVVIRPATGTQAKGSERVDEARSGHHQRGYDHCRPEGSARTPFRKTNLKRPSSGLATGPLPRQISVGISARRASSFV